MATVTGQFGSEYIELNNAATEATLKAILAALAGSADKMQKAIDLAAKVGLDTKGIQAVNAAIKEETDTVKAKQKAEDEYVEGLRTRAAKQVNAWTAVWGSMQELMNGTATASGIMSTFGSQFSGATGLVIKGFAQLAAMQEANFATYQKLASSGINFSGSLTQLRAAAANSYLTLDQFATIMKNNSEAFARMGGTADEGAVAFSKASAELLGGDAGRKLMALGFTAEDVNNGLANYIAISGGRSRQEMADTKALAKGAAEYLNELDELAQVTGKSREQQEAALKEASANEAYQAYLLTLDEEGKKKANLAMAEAMAKGGKGAAQALQSQLLGLPPMTKAAQEFTAVAPKMAAANNKMADAVKDGSKGVADIKRAGNELGVAANQTKKDLGKTGDALIMQGGSFSSTMGAIFGTANRNAQQGVETLEDAEKQRQSIEEKRRAREESEANVMSFAMRSLKELGAELWQAFSPVVTAVTYLVGFLGVLAKVVSWVVTGFNKLFTYFGFAEQAVKAIAVAVLAWLAIQKVANAQATLAASRDALLGKFTGGAGGGGGGGGGKAGILSSLFGGGGGGSGSMLQTLAAGLKAFANPQILLGAAILSGSIAILGLGIGAAIAIVGKSLPVMAEGLQAFTNINGDNLVNAAKGIALLGPALILFTGSSVVAGFGTAASKILNFFTGGGPIGMIADSVKTLTPVLPQLVQIGPALNNYASGIIAFGKAVSSVDVAKAEKLKEVMKGPGVLEGIGSAIRDVGAATAQLMTGTQGSQENSNNQLAALNSHIAELIKVARDISENTKQTVEATKDLSGDHFA